jgi:quercetin dioxygenase-like cupin family protein
MAQPEKLSRRSAMREIRTFELDHGEPAAAWRVVQPLTLQVMAGQVWVTVEGDLRDYWLAAGDTFELKRGERVWVSAGQGGTRLVLAFGSDAAGALGRPLFEAARRSVRNWVPRWLQTI